MQQLSVIGREIRLPAYQGAPEEKLSAELARCGVTSRT